MPFFKDSQLVCASFALGDFWVFNVGYVFYDEFATSIVSNG